MPTLKQLIYRHPDHRKFADRWIMLDALAAGGCAVDLDVKKKLLINPDNAEPQVIGERAKLAPYDPVIGSILMKLVSQLMADNASYAGDDDAFWQEFQAKGALITEQGMNRRGGFHGLLTHGIYRALVQGAMIAQVDTAGGSEEPYAMLRARQDLWDWAGDKEGLKYAKLHSYRYYKPGPFDAPVREHEFQVYQRTEQGTIEASVYTLRHALDKPKSDGSPGYEPAFGMNDLETMGEGNAVIEVKSEGVDLFHTSGGLYRFPVVIRTVEQPLWIADQLYDHMVSLFNHTAGGEWALLQTNYGMLKFTGVDQPHSEGNNNPANMVQHGNGYYMELPEGVDASWLVRPGNDIERSLGYQKTVKEKMLELVNKIAETAANAYAMRMQSGESKKEQRRDLDILLEVYGQDIREFAKGILDVASVARNKDTEWQVSGFTDYNTAGLMESLEEYLALDNAGIQSETLRKESRKAIVGKAIAKLNLPPEIQTTINEELDADPTFTLSPDAQRSLIELAKVNLIAPGDVLTIFNQSGLIPPEMSVDEMLANLGMSGDEPQTDNPVLAGDVV
jgi:tellurite resistance-related uncharacterized protein